MATKVCVLRAGKEYQPRHAQWLAKQIPGLVCLSDVDVAGVETVPLEHDWPGWWSKLELFSGSIPGDLLFFDIDTVITGNLDDLDVGETTMLSDFYKPHLPASGLMYIAEKDKAHVWREWMRSPVAHMQRCRTTQCWGDQGFLAGVLTPRRWQDIVPGQVVSYKVHCRNGLPPDASVVCFHGNPRPWAANQSWVPSLC